MQIYDRVYAKIDLDEIEYNIEAMRQLLRPDTKILAVVKADGYGHGAVEIAHTIESFDHVFGFAVATAEEAFVLRLHGVKKPIVILGYVFPQHYDKLVEWEIRPAVFTLDMACQLREAAIKQGRDVPIHIKVDTGMNRIGMGVNEESAKIIAQIASMEHIVVEGIFTHFARADEADLSHATGQLEKFNRMVDLVEKEGVKIPYRHCANSAAIIGMPDASMELVRAGISLYGMWPSNEVSRERITLRPALELKSHIAYIKELEAGESVSYGGTYTAKGTEMVATVPVGYADGYPRSLSNKGYVLIHGRKAPIRGRVCMDQFMVDVTDIPAAKIGDTVTLAGKDEGQELTLEELGELSGRFHYEFACCLGKRVPRVYYKNGSQILRRDSVLDF